MEPLALVLGLRLGLAAIVLVVGDKLGLELGLVQRDRVAGLALRVLGDSLIGLLELGIGLAAIHRASAEGGDQVGGDSVVHIVLPRLDGVELEGVVHLPFAEIRLVAERGNVDVRGHALDLRALAIGPVELLNRQFQCAEFGMIAAANGLVEINDLLHRPLAEGAGVADDQASAVVLDDPRENFRSARAVVVDQDDQGAVPGRPRVVVVEVADAGSVADLDDRPFVDEQARESDRFREQAAAVAAKVHHHAIHTLLLEPLDQLAAVERGADGVRVAVEDRAGVAVEGGQADNADLERLVVGPFGLDDLPLGVVLDQLDLLAGQFVDLPFLRVGGLHHQADFGAARASNVADDVAQFLLDEVDLGPVFLLDADDLVIDLQPAVLVGGHAGDDLLDHRVAVIGLKRRANAFQREVQGLLHHVLEGLRVHVVGMRVEGFGEGGQVELQEVAHVELADGAAAIAIADLQLLDGLSAFELIDHLELEQVELDPLPPTVLGLGVVGGIVVEVGVVENRVVVGEVGLLVEFFHHKRLPGVVPLQIAFEDQPGEVEVPLANLVVQGRGLGGELRDVVLLEVILLRVQVFQKILTPLLARLVVDPGLRHVDALKDLHDGTGRLLVGGFRDGSLRPDHDGRQAEEPNQRQRA